MGFWNKVKKLLGGEGDDDEKQGNGEAQPDPPAAAPAQPPPGAAKKAAPSTSAARPAATKPAATKPTSRSAPAVQTPLPATVPSVAPPKKKDLTKDPLDAGEILGLSKEDMRRRALRINPYQTAWIGRVDTIPPQSDERTALIDRGLILRGLLTEEQLQEIHRVGDLWLMHHDAVRMARIAASKSVDDALAELDRQKQALKARKKAEAAEKKKRRAEEVARRRQEDIFYLGRGVSRLLSDRRSLLESLEANGLPVLSTPGDAARALGLTISKLRWLAHHGDAVEKPHYATFEIAKRSGGTRLIASPGKELRRAQTWILEHVLSKLAVGDPAHGFVRGKSTVTCATPHVGKDVVLNLDVKDFFPTITFHRARGVFQRAGYSPAVATIFALLCTEAPRVPVTLDGKRYFAAVGPRALPQGACTSPALSNQVARKLDKRLAGMAAKHGWTYTRYADDLTLSAPAGKRSEIGMMQARVRHILEEEGFALNPKKGRVQRKGGRQEVTGIVVNTHVGLPRSGVRTLRAILHNAEKTGLAAQNRDNHPHFEAFLRGHLAYLHMVSPQKAAPLLLQLDRLTTKK